MSQQDPDTDAEPTPGPWTTGHGGNPNGKPTSTIKTHPDGGHHLGNHTYHVADANMARPEAEKLANARLIAAAGTAAQEAKEMGYDPVAAVEALPELLEALESIAVEGKKSFPDAESMIRWTLDALDRAEGSDQ